MLRDQSSCGNVKWTISPRRWGRRRRRRQTHRKGFINIIPPPPPVNTPLLPPSAISGSGGSTAATSTLSWLTLFLTTTMSSPSTMSSPTQSRYTSCQPATRPPRQYLRVYSTVAPTTPCMGPLLLSVLPAVSASAAQPRLLPTVAAHLALLPQQPTTVTNHTQLFYFNSATTATKTDRCVRATSRSKRVKL